MSEHAPSALLHRRTILASGLAAGTAFAVGRPAAASPLLGRAEHVVQIWLGGGMGQVDTFDPMPQVEFKSKTPGSLYRSIDTAVSGVQVCEYLSETAKLMDRVTAVRSLHHEVIDEHAAATNYMHTGRAVNGTSVYPSLGSIIAAQRPPEDPSIPAYVLMGYPSGSRGPGFLGAAGAFVYLTDLARGPVGLSQPPQITQERTARRQRYLQSLRDSAADKLGHDAAIADYDQLIGRAAAMSGPAAAKMFDVAEEPASLRDRYGSEFGQRCLLARRLIERGVRFIEIGHTLNFVNGTGWDVHNEGILQQHELITDLDRSLSTLMRDLDDRGLLDKTLIIISGEFGRPSGFDGRGGRGHQGDVFTSVLCGGGLAHCGAYGASDELSKRPAENPVSVPDFFATILAAVGIPPDTTLYDGARPVPATDGGQVIARLLG